MKLNEQKKMLLKDLKIYRSIINNKSTIKILRETLNNLKDLSLKDITTTFYTTKLRGFHKKKYIKFITLYKKHNISKDTHILPVGGALDNKELDNSQDVSIKPESDIKSEDIDRRKVKSDESISQAQTNIYNDVNHFIEGDRSLRNAYFVFANSFQDPLKPCLDVCSKHNLRALSLRRDNRLMLYQPDLYDVIIFEKGNDIIDLFGPDIYKTIPKDKIKIIIIVSERVLGLHDFILFTNLLFSDELIVTKNPYNTFCDVNKLKQKYFASYKELHEFSSINKMRLFNESFAGSYSYNTEEIHMNAKFQSNINFIFFDNEQTDRYLELLNNKKMNMCPIEYIFLNYHEFIDDYWYFMTELDIHVGGSFWNKKFEYIYSKIAGGGRVVIYSPFVKVIDYIQNGLIDKEVGFFRYVKTDNLDILNKTNIILLDYVSHTLHLDNIDLMIFVDPPLSNDDFNRLLDIVDFKNLNNNTRVDKLINLYGNDYNLTKQFPKMEDSIFDEITKSFVNITDVPIDSFKIDSIELVLYNFLFFRYHNVTDFIQTLKLHKDEPVNQFFNEVAIDFKPAGIDISEVLINDIVSEYLIKHKNRNTFNIFGGAVSFAEIFKIKASNAPEYIYSIDTKIDYDLVLAESFYAVDFDEGFIIELLNLVRSSNSILTLLTVHASNLYSFFAPTEDSFRALNFMDLMLDGKAKVLQIEPIQIVYKGNIPKSVELYKQFNIFIEFLYDIDSRGVGKCFINFYKI